MELFFDYIAPFATTSPHRDERKRHENVGPGMTREEHFRAHMYDMSPETRKMFEEMLDEISEFEDEKKSSNRTVERLEEQVYFANELVVSLDEWAKTDLSKPKRAQYQTLRANSQFET